MGKNRFKTGLALSGGGARALAHLGVLQGIQSHKIPVDLIVGTSMGAVIGGLYAYHGDIATVAQKLREFLESHLFQTTLARAVEYYPENDSEGFFNRLMWLVRKGVYYTNSILRSTLVPEETYLNVMSDLIPEHPIEDLRMPFAAVAVDILKGEEVILQSGCLRKAVSASVAIPGILPPLRYNGRLLVDGGWVDNVPVAPAISMGAHFVIAVDASSQIDDLGPPPATAIDLLHRSDEISRILMSHHSKAIADILLTPQIGQLSWTDFTDMDRCISAGRKVLIENKRNIRRKKMRRQIVTLRGCIHPVRMCRWGHPFVLT